MDSLQTTSMINLSTIDGVIISFNKVIIEFSKTINNMLEICADDLSSPIPLLHEKCTEEIMLKIKEFLSYIYLYPNEIKQIEEYETTRGTITLSEWFQEYVNIDKELLFDIVIVADYLEIKPLITLICGEIANRIKNLSPEEINQAFS